MINENTIFKYKYDYNLFKILAAFKSVSSVLAKQKRRVLLSCWFSLKTDIGIEAIPASMVNLLAKSTSLSLLIDE